MTARSATKAVPVRRSGATIVDAIAAAAHRLFVERGPAAVSLREIAAAAEVNLGLIHRYVGGKDDVVALVLDRHGEAATRALAPVVDLEGLLDLIASGARPSARLFAGILLDDVDAVRLKREFPVAVALTDALRAAPAGFGADAATTAALLQSLVLGWEIFGPFLLAAAGADRAADDPEARVALRAALQAMVREAPVAVG